MTTSNASGDDRGWVLVGGGSGGIGRAACRALATDGWDVALTFHTNESAAMDTAEAVRAAGRRAAVVGVDLTDAAATADVVNTATAGEPLGAVVYAAGPHITMRYVAETPPARFARQMTHDAVACYNLLHPAIPRLRETRGALVAVITPAVERHAKKDLLSSAPKAAIEAVVRGIASEEGRFGVRANCVGVGLIEGEGMWGALVDDGAYTDEIIAIAKRNIPLRRFGTPAEVAGAVRWLLSDEASWVTGQSLHVDGGYAV